MYRQAPEPGVELRPQEPGGARPSALQRLTTLCHRGRLTYGSYFVQFIYGYYLRQGFVSFFALVEESIKHRGDLYQDH